MKLRRVGWLPGLAVGALSMGSVLRHDVPIVSLLTYIAYFAVAVLLPGLLVSRLLVGSRDHLVADLAFGSATGLALQVVVWGVLRPLGADAAIPWWWAVVLVAFGAHPALRHHYLVRYRQNCHLGWSWSMAAISAYVVAGADLKWFRLNPIPPAGGTAYVDTWWHLSIIREFLRPGPPEVAQVAGESLTYHANAHAHVAISSITTNLDADLVFLRLWIIPVVLTTVVMFAKVAEEATRRIWAGPVASALAFVVLTDGYLIDGLPPVFDTPIRYASPSQTFLLPLAFGAAWGLLLVVRSAHRLGLWLWIALLVVAGSGAKPTVVLVMLGATGLAAAFLAVRDRTVPVQAIFAVGGLLAIQLWTLSANLDERGSSITLLGSLKSLPIYPELTGDRSLRAVNGGLLLDSLTGTRAWVAAATTLGWLALVQIVQLIGLASLADRRLRRDPATWWLAGAVLSGLATFFTLDHSASSQVYFVHLALPFGVVLTTMLVASVFSDVTRDRRLQVGALGVVIGAAAALTARAVSRSLAQTDGFGMIDRVAIPVLVVAAFGLGTYLGCRRWPAATVTTSRGAVALLLAALIGIGIPTTVDGLAKQSVSFAQAFEPEFGEEAPGYLSPDEQAAAVWLRTHSSESDIIASNTQCRPLTTEPGECRAVGFWVSGIAGRRVLLEGWGYTVPAHKSHGEDGLHRNRTPPGWPDRYELSIAAIEAPTPEIIDDLRSRGVRWIFASRRAGPVSDRLADLATPVYDNGAVIIFELVR